MFTEGVIINLKVVVVSADVALLLLMMMMIAVLVVVLWYEVGELQIDVEIYVIIILIQVGVEWYAYLAARVKDVVAFVGDGYLFLDVLVLMIVKVGVNRL